MRYGPIIERHAAASRTTRAGPPKWESVASSFAQAIGRIIWRGGTVPARSIFAGRRWLSFVLRIQVLAAVR